VPAHSGGMAVKMNQNENKASLNNDVAISSRIRLARNLEAYPFSSRLTREQGAEILEKVGNAVFNDTNVDICTNP